MKEILEIFENYIVNLRKFLWCTPFPCAQKLPLQPLHLLLAKSGDLKIISFLILVMNIAPVLPHWVEDPSCSPTDRQ